MPGALSFSLVSPVEVHGMNVIELTRALIDIESITDNEERIGKQVRDPKAYTMSLDEVWHRAGEGWSEAVTEFHIVGGLHPELTLDWYCEMLRGLKQRFPQVHLKAFT